MCTFNAENQGTINIRENHIIGSFGAWRIGFGNAVRSVRGGKNSRQPQDAKSHSHLHTSQSQSGWSYEREDRSELTPSMCKALPRPVCPTQRTKTDARGGAPYTPSQGPCARVRVECAGGRVHGRWSATRSQRPLTHTLHPSPYPQLHGHLQERRVDSRDVVSVRSPHSTTISTTKNRPSSTTTPTTTATNTRLNHHRTYTQHHTSTRGLRSNPKHIGSRLRRAGGARCVMNKSSGRLPREWGDAPATGRRRGDTRTDFHDKRIDDTTELSTPWNRLRARRKRGRAAAPGCPGCGGRRAGLTRRRRRGVKRSAARWQLEPRHGLEPSQRDVENALPLWGGRGEGALRKSGGGSRLHFDSMCIEMMVAGKQEESASDAISAALYTLRWRVWPPSTSTTTCFSSAAVLGWSKA